MMEILGYIASALVGITLGLIGGGGSMLTVPIMVYLFGVSPLLAISYSLFIVGLTSLIGSMFNFKKRLIDLRATLIFGAASMVTVFVTRKFIVPAIPEELVTVRGFTITESYLTMILFGLLLLIASLNMIRNKGEVAQEKECSNRIRFFKLLAYGISIGLVTGFLGAGGGFLLIPVLVFNIKLPMKKAVATSLLIIALNSLVGFAGDFGHFQIDWPFLLIISAIAGTGIFIGGQISKKISGEKLKNGFGWFLLIMGSYIIIKEITS